MRDRLLANGLRAEKVSLLAPLLFCGSALDYVPALDPRAILYAGRVTLEKGLRRWSNWHPCGTTGSCS